MLRESLARQASRSRETHARCGENIPQCTGNSLETKRKYAAAVSGQVGDKSTRRHPSRRQVESATSNSATTAVNSATTAVKSATNALVKSATMIENGNNESLKLRYYYHHDGPNTLNCVFILLYL